MHYPIIMLLLIASTPILSRETSYVADAFGYLPANQCSYDYLNIDAQAIPLSLVAAGSDPANDEGAAVIDLPAAFFYYDEDHTQLVVSSNGYLAFESDLARENGADFGNDCPFPSIPDNQPQSLKRIMPFHDDMIGSPSGQIQWAHYINCPLAAYDSACTVIEWDNWQIADQADVFSFQVILVHQPAVIVMQFNDQTPTANSASVGFQHAGLFSGQVLSCNQSDVTLNSQAFCFQNDLIFTNGFEQ